MGKEEVRDHDVSTEVEESRFPALRSSGSRDEETGNLTSKVRGSKTGSEGVRGYPGQSRDHRGLPE